MNEVTDKPHFYTRAEFYISVGAFIISLVSLYFTYLTSPLSDIGRAKLTYSTFGGLGKTRDGGHEWRMACEIQNTSNNPAEDVIVTVPRPDSTAKSRLDVLGGLEYTMLNQDNDNVTVKFPHIPPRAGAVVRVFTPLTMSADSPPPTGVTNNFGFFTTVVHKHGVGVRQEVRQQ
jgi:hypothetical protein